MPYVNMNNASAGMIRYNNYNMEVYDGHSWMILQSNHSHVTLSPDIQEIVSWAKLKMAEEAKFKALADKYPEIADLHGKLEMMIALVKDTRD